MAALFDQAPKLGAVQDVMRRGRAADDDVDLAEGFVPGFEGDGPSAQLTGQGFGLVVRSVRDDNPAGAAGKEGAGGLLAGVAGADDQDRAILEGSEDSFGQLDRH